MIIKSPFKDYYDFVAHLYGGGDPNIQYIRNRFGDDSGIVYTYHTFKVTQKGITQLPLYTLNNVGFCCKWLAVAGKLYLLVATENDTSPIPNWQILSHELHSKLISKLVRVSKDGTYDISKYVGCYSSYLVEMSRNIKAPVFTFGQDYNPASLHVNVNVPILGNLGVAKIVSADQMYQDISYFVGNIIKESPDMAPPSSMTNKEKIVGHGFDLKQSFRHRM